MKSFRCIIRSTLGSVLDSAIPGGIIITALALCPAVAAQEKSADSPVLVQPGAPGQPTRTLSPLTRAKLPPTSVKDVEFMQGMIMHHAQAVEMTAMIESRTQNRGIRLIGQRISKSQSDEIEFMNKWLAVRGHRVSMEHHDTDKPNKQASAHDAHSAAGSHALMPGMLTPKQMDALQKAEGAEFDRLFLRGMIQHHNGALVMVKDLFNAAGAGQDAELFNFASDVDSGQRAEIRSMQTLLDKKP